MSAPDTRLQRQKRRHRGPLIGMAVVVLLVLALFVWFLGGEVDEVTTPAEAPETTAEPVPEALPEEPATVPATPEAVPAPD